MTREEAIKKLNEINKEYRELAHIEADEILCQFLVSLGYQDVVDTWDEIPKWYA
jgi:hypothetical protein